MSRSDYARRQCEPVHQAFVPLGNGIADRGGVGNDGNLLHYLIWYEFTHPAPLVGFVALRQPVELQAEVEPAVQLQYGVIRRCRTVERHLIARRFEPRLLAVA